MKGFISPIVYFLLVLLIDKVDSFLGPLIYGGNFVIEFQGWYFYGPTVMLIGIGVLVFFLNGLLKKIEKVYTYKFRTHFRQSLLLYLSVLAAALHIPLPYIRYSGLFSNDIRDIFILTIVVNALFVLMNTSFIQKLIPMKNIRYVIGTALIILLSLGVFLFLYSPPIILNSP